MDRFAERIRDPKWIAIGLTALVIAGSAVKIALAPGEPSAPTSEVVATATADVDLAPGAYRISGASWDLGAHAAGSGELGELGAGPTGAADVQDDLAPGAVLTQEEEQFLRNAHRIWNGLCIAIEGR